MNVKLLTAAGEFVRDATILPFKTAPDVIIWGSRVFIKNGGASVVGEDVIYYHEAFAYTIPELTK